MAHTVRDQSGAILQQLFSPPPGVRIDVARPQELERSTRTSSWLRESRNVEGMASSKKQKWTGAEKLRVVIAARGLSETELGALLRREGVHGPHHQPANALTPGERRTVCVGKYDVLDTSRHS